MKVIFDTDVGNDVDDVLALAMLHALQMLGGDVPHDHGGPVRLYVAPMYGYKSTKWLSSIELTADVVPAGAPAATTVQAGQAVLEAL